MACDDDCPGDVRDDATQQVLEILVDAVEEMVKTRQRLLYYGMGHHSEKPQCVSSNGCWRAMTDDTMIKRAQLLAFLAREKRKDQLWRLVELVLIAVLSLFVGAVATILLLTLR